MHVCRRKFSFLQFARVRHISCFVDVGFPVHMVLCGFVRPSFHQHLSSADAGPRFIPWFLIDRIGRRPLLIGSVALMACVFAGLTGTVRQVQYDASNSSACGVVATVLAFLYMGLFTTGFQATVWVYPPEILPLRIRAKGTAAATATNWIINFCVVEIFPIAIQNCGWRTYIIFCVFNASFVPVMYFFCAPHPPQLRFFRSPDC